MLMNIWGKLSRFYRNFSWWRRWRHQSDRERGGQHLFPQCRGQDSTLSGFWFSETEEPLEHMLRRALQSLASLGQVFTNKSFSLSFWQKHPGATDMGSSRVFIDARILAASSASPTERLDVASGIVLHELGHLEWTSSALTQKAHARSPVFRAVWNTIEDERIERLAIKRAPGFSEFLQTAREFLLAGNSQDLVKFAKSRERWEQLLIAIFLLIRVPAVLPWWMRRKFKKELRFVVLELSPFPLTPEGAYQTAEKIVNHLFKGTENQPSSNKIISQLNALLGHSLGGSEEELSDELKQAIGQIEPLEVTGPFSAGPRLRGGFGRSSGSELDLSGPVVFVDALENADTYDKLVRELRPLILSLRHHLELPRRDKRTVFGIPAGRLRPALLHRVVISVNVLSQTRRQREPKTALVLLIDQSGSMADKKILQAQRAAILIKEAVKSHRRIRLFIFGHAADIKTYGPNSTVIYRYDTPVHPATKRLGSLAASRNNRDGVAIAAVASEVERVMSWHHRKILIVLSDGAPAANGYRGEASIRHTREVVQDLKNRGWQVIEIAIPPHANANKMFEHVISLRNIEYLPQELAKLIKQLF